MTVNANLKPRSPPAARVMVADLPPDRPCWNCRGRLFWRRPTGGWLCETCQPCPREKETVEWHHLPQ